MTETIYITATRYKIEKMTKRVTDTLAKGERVAAIEIEFPDEMFEEIPLPVIKIVLPPTQIGTSTVTVDGQPQAQSVTAAQAQEWLVQRLMGQLIMDARASTDPALRDNADNALHALLNAGVKVEIGEDSQ